MANSTVYDIRLNYILQDKVTKPARVLDAQLARTGKTADGLGKQFRRMAAGASAYFGIRAGVKHLIGFNSNMEQAKIQMGGMIQLATKMDSAASSREAIKLVDTLQQKAKLSVGTTKDMVDMASMITRPVLAAGLGMDQLANFTAQSVVAAKAFGIESGMAARDIESALMGQLRSVDRFSRALLEPLGFVGEKGREAFNELGAAARAAKLEEALGGPAIAAMAKAQEKSFSGVLSTFQDTLQMTMGQVGAPLFAAITTEIKTWNEWITKNGHSLGNMADKFGRGLVSGFRMIKGVVGFMVDHADLLLTVAKIWAGVKIGQKIGGMAESFGEVAGRMTRRAAALQFGAGMDKAGLATANLGIKITGVARSFATFLPAIGAATAGLYSMWEAFKDIGDNRKRIAAGKEQVKELSVTTVKDFSKDKTTTDEKLLRLTALQSARDLAGLIGVKKGPSDLERALVEDLRSRAPELKTLAQKFAVQAQQTGFVADGRLKGISGQLTTAILDQMGVPSFAKDTEVHLAAFKEVQRTAEDLDYQLRSSGNSLDAWGRALAGNLLPAALERGIAEFQIKAPLDDSKGKKPEFKVTIQRIEVQSDDPARFVVGLTETVRDAVRNRSAAYDTLLEGR